MVSSNDIWMVATYTPGLPPLLGEQESNFVELERIFRNCTNPLKEKIPRLYLLVLDILSVLNSAAFFCFCICCYHYWISVAARLIYSPLVINWMHPAAFCFPLAVKLESNISFHTIVRIQNYLITKQSFNFSCYWLKDNEHPILINMFDIFDELMIRFWILCICELHMRSCRVCH